MHERAAFVVEEGTRVDFAAQQFNETRIPDLYRVTDMDASAVFDR